MRGIFRQIVAVCVACCLAAALPAIAGANLWTAIGPDGAIDTSLLAVDPSASSTIYTVVDSVVTRTTDGGVHWDGLGIIDSGNGVSGLWVSLAVDPASPSTLYVGSGFSFGGPSVYKSVDAGAHWMPASNGLPPIDVVALAIAPSRSSTLYVAGALDGGVSKSSDGGSSWTQVNNGLPFAFFGPFVSTLAVDPTDADTVYVATAPASGARIFKSTNGAARWRRVPVDFPIGSSPTSFAIDPATPSTVYATFANYDNLEVGGVLKSSDSGETWSAAQNGLPAAWALAIDPGSPSQIYAATQGGVFRSTDGAMSWSPINSGLPSLSVYAIAIDRSGSLLRVATGAGLFEHEVSPFPATVSLIEYVHSAFGHYFITSIPDEISKLDNGTFAGWTRTGLRFNAYGAADAGALPVCRFFSEAFAPKSSHFYTSSSTECATRQADPNWLLESSAAFYIAAPANDGSCPADFAPVYRLYNNGQGGAPNHRFTTDLNERAQTMAQGWVPEGLGPDGVAMCAPR